MSSEIHLSLPDKQPTTISYGDLTIRWDGPPNYSGTISNPKNSWSSAFRIPNGSTAEFSFIKVVTKDGKPTIESGVIILSRA